MRARLVRALRVSATAAAVAVAIALHDTSATMVVSLAYGGAMGLLSTLSGRSGSVDKAMLLGGAAVGLEAARELHRALAAERGMDGRREWR